MYEEEIEIGGEEKEKKKKKKREKRDVHYW